LGVPTKTLYEPLVSPLRATCPAHLILLDLDYPNDSWWEVSIIMHLLNCPLCPEIFVSALFLNTLSLCFSVSVTSPDLHPCKRAGNITVAWVSIFILLNSKLEQNIQYRMIASIPWIHSARNLFINGIFIR
jgi:hypothetical protein